MKKNVCWLILLMIGPFSGAQTLEDYFKIAAEGNPGLKSKYKRFEAAMAQVTQVKALPDPNLSFGYFISPVETRVGAQHSTLSLSQRFPWFGTLKVEKQATTLLAESHYQLFIEARNRLLYEVSSAYYAVFELNQWILIEQNNIQILKSYKTISQNNFEHGTGTMVDVLWADVVLKEALTNLSILNEKHRPLEVRFNTLLNRAKEETIVVPKQLAPISIALDSIKGLVLDENPTLKALDLKSQSYEAQRSVAIKKGLPKFGVGITYTMVDKRDDGAIADNGKDIIMPMVSMSVPIFRGKYKASKREADLMKTAVTLEQESKRNDLIRTYEMTLFDIQQQHELLKLYTEQIKISNQSLKLLFTGYKTSGKNFEEVLRMQQQVLNYKKNKISAQSNLRVALARLDYLID